ncbi:hypothetical protein [Neobacillus sp. YIM B06451]|uniref:hypothetical protein n=1 Tax=Neobacillus sp. YIM B06451 TaxID=3070994 RepID=UPI002931F0FA|nr:hypothetical protein [Neobacillus sp. YIM B06451]
MDNVGNGAKGKKNKMVQENLKLNSFVEKEYDELGRIIIHDLNEVPENVNEEETIHYWETHAMSEELMAETYFEEDDEDLPPPRKQSTKPD